MERVKKKICLLGDPAVGKTSLIRRFVIDKYDDKYISTLGTKVSKKDVTITKPKEVNLTMLIWDLAGQQEFHKVHVSGFKNAAGALVVGDITRKETVDNLENWVSKLYSVENQIPVILLINKCDLKDQAMISPDYMTAFASRLNAKYYFTSAKSGDNVEEAFNALAKMMTGEVKPAAATIDQKAVSARRELTKGNLILELEDKLIMRFCEILGDNELGMNIVRKQFDDAGVDFNNPTRENLHEIANRLANAIKSFKGEETSQKAKLEFMRIVKSG